MTPSRAVPAASVLLAAVLALAACGDDGAAPATEGSPEVAASSDTSPTTEGSESSDSSEEAEPAAIPTAYPQGGLRYVGFPRVSEKSRAALEVFAAFHRGRLQLARTAAMNDLVADNATEPVVRQWQGTVDYLQSHDAHYRGETVATFTDVTIRSRFVAVDLCLDGSDLRYVVNGQPGPVSGPPRVPFRTVLTRTDTGWRVTESRTLDGTC